jgi:hypothetical protein
MRAALFAILLLCGCGGSDTTTDPTPDPATCSDFSLRLQQVAAANRTCQVDSDCHWVADGCLGMCNTYVNSDGSAAAREIVEEATAAHCNEGCLCSALPPACNNGVCGVRMPNRQ